MGVVRRTVLQGIAAAAAGPAWAQTASTATPHVPATPAHRRILIKGGHVATLDESIGELAGGDVLIDGTTIAAIGKNVEAADAEIIDARAALVLPGLIDTVLVVHRPAMAGAKASAGLGDSPLPSVGGCCEYASLGFPGVLRPAGLPVLSQSCKSFPSFPAR